jgi:hypothetical protein
MENELQTQDSLKAYARCASKSKQVEGLSHRLKPVGGILVTRHSRATDVEKNSNEGESRYTFTLMQKMIKNQAKMLPAHANTPSCLWAGPSRAT